MDRLVGELKEKYGDNIIKPTFVEREDDQELLQKLKEQEAKNLQIDEEIRKKVDAELNLSMTGEVEGEFFIKDGDEKTGRKTFVMRNGKLVPGKAEKREATPYSNWTGGNADPEDIRRHREMMDRMSYRGPKWEDVGVPKSIIEETSPVYRKVEAEKHPSM